MTGFLARRLLQLIPVVLLASIGIWAIIYAVPGGPVGGLVGENATPEQIRAVTAEFGLDQPVWLQYFNWFSHAARGDLGLSIQSREPVWGLIAARLPASFQLAAASLAIGLLLGVPVAMASALHPHGALDRILGLLSALALGVPTFWLGILLILAFAVTLHWLPSASAYIPFWQSPPTMFANILLPALCLGVYVSGIFARFLRAALVGELQADYVRTARSKGLTEGAILRRHVMRNALLPFVTIVGLMMANFIGGTVVTEAVFTYPGLGRLLIQAIGARDYPLIQGCILTVLVIYVLINVLVDALYAYIDPRIDVAG